MWTETDGLLEPGGNPEPDDDPEAQERRERTERLLRRQAEKRGDDPDEAIREYWRSQEQESAKPTRLADAGGAIGTPDRCGGR